MSPSSIFSFDTLRVRPSDLKPWPLLVAVLIFVAAELLAAWLIHDIQGGWNYWSRNAAARFLGYQQRIANGASPTVLVAGDSTAAYGFSPKAFDSALRPRSGGKSAETWNLGVLANFPLAFDATFNDVLLRMQGEHSPIVLISFARGGFVSTPRIEFNERSILGSPVVRSARGEWLIADHLALARLWRLRVQIYHKLRGRLEAARLNLDAGRFRHQGAERGKLRPPKEKGRLAISPRRLAVLDRTFRNLNRLGIRTILLLPPLHSFERQGWENPDAYRQAVQPLCERHGVLLWDYTDGHGLEQHMLDLVHLDDEGARLFSQRLAQRFAETISEVVDEGS